GRYPPDHHPGPAASAAGWLAAAGAWLRSGPGRARPAGRRRVHRGAKPKGSRRSRTHQPGLLERRMTELTDQELLRYSRQILLKQIDVDGQLRLKQSRILIVGLGGLGSPVALYLAAAGVGELHLADFDQVDLTNLQRQIIHDGQSLDVGKVDSAMARLARLNPEVRLVPRRTVLDADTLAEAVAAVDLVLDCCDNFATREAVNAACMAAGKPLVSGAAIRLEGQLSVFDPRRDDSPCYHCLYGHGSEAELT